MFRLVRSLATARHAMEQERLAREKEAREAYQFSQTPHIVRQGIYGGVPETTYPAATDERAQKVLAEYPPTPTSFIGSSDENMGDSPLAHSSL